MSMKRPLCLVIALAALSACGTTTQSSRNATPPYLTTAIQNTAPEEIALPAELAVQGIEISVPQTLKVSEADVFVPVADIVWRGDPLGDRHTQVAAIFESAAAEATTTLTQGRPVIVALEVTRFHGLTEKARYVTGGNYAMHFMMTLRDAQTGMVIDGPRPIVADVKGSGGVRAIAEDNAGRTEKVVVTQRLSEVLQYELTHLVLPSAL